MRSKSAVLTCNWETTIRQWRHIKFMAHIHEMKRQRERWEICKLCGPPRKQPASPRSSKHRTLDSSLHLTLVGSLSWMKVIFSALNNQDYVLEMSVVTEHFGKREEVTFSSSSKSLDSELLIKSEHQVILHFQMSWLRTGHFNIYKWAVPLMNREKSLRGRREKCEFRVFSLSSVT